MGTSASASCAISRAAGAASRVTRAKGRLFMAYFSVAPLYRMQLGDGTGSGAG